MDKSKSNLWFSLGIVGLISACMSVSQAPVEVVDRGLIIHNVNVVNTRDGSITPNRAIVIRDGKIHKITASASIRVTGTAQGVDGLGKYLVPGYLDMHTHAIFEEDKQPSAWPLLIAHGITGIREMAGSAALIQRARQVNVESAAGRLLAPEILSIPGAIFAGQAPAPAAATQFVQQQKADGADFIKVVAGGRASILAILDEAKAQGLGVAGHLVPSVSALESSNAGWKAIEHLGSGWGFLLDCANDEINIRQALMTGQGARPPFPPTFTLTPRLYDSSLNAPFYQRIFDSYNEAKCQTLAQAFAKNGTWHVPTLIRLRTMSFSDEPQYREDPNLQYVDKTARALWEKLAKDYSANVSSSAASTVRQFYSLQLKATELLKENGVKILSGSDLGGIWVIPGVSLHQEFAELAAAGLTPLEVLQSTTLNGAEFLGKLASMGTIEAGKHADLVLLEANPISSVANLSKISAVVLKGKFLPKEALEKLKSDTALSLSNQPLKNLSAALDPNHRH